MIINGSRALAYTARCGAIEKIEGADNIELMNVLGWKVITKIGEFKEGDVCVYFEIDSKLPEKEWSEFMAPMIVTEKLDGTSCTYILERKKGKDKFEFYVLSRNIRQQDENQKTYHDHNIYWDLAFKYDIENKLRGYLEEHPELTYVCIQGEGVGSVQGNPLKLDEDDLYVFNFIDSERGRWNSVGGKIRIESWGMKWVPILDIDYRMPDNMEEFKQYADGKSAVNPKVKREGVVIRNPKDDFSFKNVLREYLLKHDG